MCLWRCGDTGCGHIVLNTLPRSGLTDGPAAVRPIYAKTRPSAHIFHFRLQPIDGALNRRPFGRVIPHVIVGKPLIGCLDVGASYAGAAPELVEIEGRRQPLIAVVRSMCAHHTASPRPLFLRPIIIRSFRRIPAFHQSQASDFHGLLQHVRHV